MKTIFDVEEVWQVRIQNNIWQSIRIQAIKRKTTYSWIVRYCVFRFLSDQSFQLDENFIELYLKSKAIFFTDSDNETTEKDYHRHQLCLYGDDIRVIKMIATMFDINVTDLVRMALIRFLPLFGENKVDEEDFYWHGIKITKVVIPYRAYSAHKALFFSFEFALFSPVEYLYMRGQPQEPLDHLGMTMRTSKLVAQQLGDYKWRKKIFE